MVVDRCSQMILMATALQLFFFLVASSNKHVVIDITIDIVYLICEINKKISYL